MAEVHVIETQIARGRQRLWRRGCQNGRLFAAQFHHAPEADGHSLNGDIQPEQALHRPDGHAQVGGKRDQRAQLPGALHHPVSADQKGAGADSEVSVPGTAWVKTR
jgi:hypothetical protein